jgi:hypothetical protein
MFADPPRLWKTGRELEGNASHGEAAPICVLHRLDKSEQRGPIVNGNDGLCCRLGRAKGSRQQPCQCDDRRTESHFATSESG